MPDAGSLGDVKYMVRTAVKYAVVTGGSVMLAVVMAACGGGSSSGGADTLATQGGAAKATPTPPPQAKIMIADNSVTPAELTIAAGTNVVWEWSGANPHSVLLGGRASDTLTGSGKFERVFSTPGTTFPYQCGVHGAAMSGKIIVQ